MTSHLGSEGRFVKAFLKHLARQSVPLNGGMIRSAAIAEFPLPDSGIADIILADVSFARRRRLNRDLLHRIASSRSFAALFNAYSEPWTRDQEVVARRLGVSTTTVREHARFLSSFQRRTIERHRKALTGLELWAIEAKLHDWKRAVRQASKYTLCSTGSIILMPHRNIGPALAHARTIRSLGIGLWSFNPGDMRLERHCAPRKRLPLSAPLKYQIAARFWLKSFRRSIA
jgi:lambda repressor-like predicted transcriptional regulator